MFIQNSAKNSAKFLIDIPSFLYIFTSCLVTSLIKNFTRNRKNLESSDIVLVTGAASGIGQNVVLKLAKLFPESTYVLWDINKNGLEETAKICKNFGALKLRTFVVDLSKRPDVLKAAALVREQVGGVTVLWNNAGLSPYQKFLDVDPDLEEKVIRVNLLSHMWIIREFLPDMIRRGKGHVISTCSGLAFYRWSYLTNYVASKYGLRGFLETLKLEMRQHPEKPNINFSTIYPGFVKTPMIQVVSWEPRYTSGSFEPMDLDDLGDEIVDGILKEKEDIIVPGSLRFLDVIFRIVPSQLIDSVENRIFGKITVSNSASNKNN